MICYLLQFVLKNIWKTSLKEINKMLLIYHKEEVALNSIAHKDHLVLYLAMVLDQVTIILLQEKEHLSKVIKTALERFHQKIKVKLVTKTN